MSKQHNKYKIRSYVKVGIGLQQWLLDWFNFIWIQLLTVIVMNLILMIIITIYENPYLTTKYY